MLQTPGKLAINAAYTRLVDVVTAVTARPIRPAHHAHTKRLALLGERLRTPGRVIPGLTTHQAKGGEWDVVAVRLSNTEREALAGGLSQFQDQHRKLYVACTRARSWTLELV